MYTMEGATIKTSFPNLETHLNKTLFMHVTAAFLRAGRNGERLFYPLLPHKIGKERCSGSPSFFSCDWTLLLRPNGILDLPLQTTQGRWQQGTPKRAATPAYFSP
jgi:hypothetical protein